MMSAGDILQDDVLLPGDVVVDSDTHRPMQVTGYDPRDAENVPEVWNSDVNRHHYDLSPDASVIELIETPTGRRYFVPDAVQLYPEDRLKRVLPEPPTQERRPQQKVVRAVLAHLVSDARQRGHENVADAILALCKDHWSGSFVHEIDEFSRNPASMRGMGDA